MSLLIFIAYKIFENRDHYIIQSFLYKESDFRWIKKIIKTLNLICGVYV